MKSTSIWMFVWILIFFQCGTKNEDSHGHEHEASGLEPLAYTIYSEHTELFVEFKPLVVGSKSTFAAHFTILGERFLPMTKGSVTLSLVVGNSGIRHKADTMSVPGIYLLALIPKAAGSGKLIFDINTGEYQDQIIIENVPVYASEEEAGKSQPKKDGSSDDISFLKEQAWKVEFANTLVKKTTFHEIIKTSGKILPAPGDEVVVTSNTSGIVRFTGKNMTVGSTVLQQAPLFVITAGNLTENNLDTRYKEARENYDKAKSDYDRSQILVQDKIISEAEFLRAKTAFNNARVGYQAMSKNYTTSGQRVLSPMAGFIKNLLVEEGQFVEAGTPLAMVSKNKKLILEAYISQKYFNKLPSISAARFRQAGSDYVHNTADLQGKVSSFGKNASGNPGFLPLIFEINNFGNLIPGSSAEIFLLSTPISNAIVIPESAIMEEQGELFVYVQTGGESFRRLPITTGGNDGTNVHVLSGLEEGDRLVTKGAYQIKLSTASGTLPAHGHSH